MPPFVAINPGSGLGNQLFMMAAALGYAERYGYEPVFWEEPKSSWEHKGSAFRIRAMFPTLRVLTEAERTQLPWLHMKAPHEAAMTYIPLPSPQSPAQNVLLEGYFQSDLYGPSQFPTVPPPPLLKPEFVCHDWRRTFFFHVRRGDYLHLANAHHAMDLRAYWRTCLAEMPADLTCFVVSDDMAWCKENLGAFVGNREVLWCPADASDVETFFWMTACEAGGICANSTFSWWAAWYVRRRVGSAARIYMPKVWGTYPLPPPTHLYPAWALVR